MKQINALVVFAVVFTAVLLIATPFASALSTPEEKLLARLHARQSGCLTAQCTAFATQLADCLQTNRGSPVTDCICKFKNEALGCYSTCNDRTGSLTEQELDNMCRGVQGGAVTRT